MTPIKKTLALVLLLQPQTKLPMCTDVIMVLDYVVVCAKVL